MNKEETTKLVDEAIHLLNEAKKDDTLLNALGNKPSAEPLKLTPEQQKHLERIQEIMRKIVPSHPQK